MLFAVFTALLLAILVPNLIDLGYWPADAEILILSVGAVIVALLFTVVSKLHAFVPRAIIGILVYWIADAYFLDNIWLCIAIGLGTVLLFSTRIEPNIRILLTTFSVVFVVFSLLGSVRPLLVPPLVQDAPQVAQEVEAKALPPVIHIVLDENGSPDAAARLGYFDPDVAASVTASYVDRGFRVFRDTHALAGITKVSISHMVGLDPAHLPIDYNTEESRAEGFEFNKIIENHWLQLLLDRGYRVTVMKGSYLDLCGQYATECHLYRVNGEGHSMTRFKDKLWQRTAFALLVMDFHYFNKGHVGKVALYREISKGLSKLGVGLFTRGYMASGVSALAILDELDERLTKVQPGEAYIAHLMLPHNPHILDAQCDLKSLKDWTITTYKDVSISPARRYDSYWEQMACTHSRVMSIIDHVTSSPGGKDAIFIIHGDHGARILGPSEHVHPQSEDSPERKSDALDALFVVRAPSILAPGTDDTPMTISERFDGIVEQVFK